MKSIAPGFFLVLEWLRVAVTDSKGKRKGCKVVPEQVVAGCSRWAFVEQLHRLTALGST